MKEQPKEATPAPAAAPPTPKRKKTVLTQLQIRKREQAAGAVPTPAPPKAAATPPVVPKSPPPPRTVVTPAELTAAAGAPANPVQAQMADGANPMPIEGSVLEMLFARAMRARTDTKPANDPGMAMIQAIGHQVQHGKPLKDIEDVVVPQLGEMSPKLQLYLNALHYHNMFERGALLGLVRWTLEKGLWEDLINQKLSPAEKLALLQLCIKEMDKVQVSLTEFQSSLEEGSAGGKGTSQDIEAAVERTDRLLSKVEDPEAKDLQGTSPVGRELVRRMTNKAEKAANKILEAQSKT